MNMSLLSMLLAQALSFALGVLVYEALFSYSFKRRKNFLIRVLISFFGTAGLAVGMAFAVYGSLIKIVDAATVWQPDIMRAICYILFVAIGMGVMAFCFDEKPMLILFTAVAANAALTVSTSLYAIWVELFKLNSIFYSMYTGYDVMGFVAYYLTHIVVVFAVWLLFARPFAKTYKDFGQHINKFTLGLYVIYAFYTATVSGSQFFNMKLMVIDSVAIPLIFNGFTAGFGVFVLFVQRFNLLWVKDLQRKEATENFYSYYKERVVKQQENMKLAEEKIKLLKERLASALKDYASEELIDELQKDLSLFNSGIQTDNDALDLLFTQKSMILSSLGIKTSVMVEGKAFAFMDLSDISVFFGNAVDNAITYLGKVAKEKRFLRISTYRQYSLLFVRIENYCEEDIYFGKDGLPRSNNETLPDYGTQTIREIAAKYDGTAIFAREGDLFVLTAMFNCDEMF